MLARLAFWKKAETPPPPAPPAPGRPTAPAVTVAGLADHCLFLAAWPDVGGADDETVLQVGYRLGRAMFATAGLNLPDGEDHPVLDAVSVAADGYGGPADHKVANIAGLVFAKLLGGRKAADKSKPLLRPDQMFPRRVHEDDE